MPGVMTTSAVSRAMTGDDVEVPVPVTVAVLVTVSGPVAVWLCVNVCRHS